MTDLSPRAQGAAAILAFDVMKHPFDPQLVELFDDLNRRHFDGALPVIPVCQAMPDDYGRREDPLAGHGWRPRHYEDLDVAPVPRPPSRRRRVPPSGVP